MGAHPITIALFGAVVLAVAACDIPQDPRLHEEGAVIAGEAFVVPSSASVTLDQLEEAARAVLAVDWKIYDVVVTAVKSVERRRSPAGQEVER